MGDSLGLDILDLQSRNGVEVFAGNRIPKGSIPIAQAYAGHQFGFFTIDEKNNPAIIPKNHRVEEALEAAVKKEEYDIMEKLLSVLSAPYEYSPEQEEYSNLPPFSKNHI